MRINVRIRSCLSLDGDPVLVRAGTVRQRVVPAVTELPTTRHLTTLHPDTQDHQTLTTTTGKVIINSLQIPSAVKVEKVVK